MVPARAELRDLESIRLGIARSQSTLRDAVHAVLASRMVLSDTMPMDRGTIVLHRIFDVDDELVAPGRSNGGTRVLAVEEHANSRSVAVWITGAVRDLEVISHGVASDGEL